MKGIILVFFQLQSNKRACQEILIDNGLLAVIVEKLDEERDTMNKFMMEYTSALLVNLILARKGLDKAEEIKSKILMTLINLMETDSTEVKQFIQAALYALLERKVFR
jgi:uncharacterized protein YdiU (UPF0061 family)